MRLTVRYYRYLLPCLSLIFSLVLATYFNNSDYRIYTFTLGLASFFSSLIFTLANPKILLRNKKTLFYILLSLILAFLFAFFSPYYRQYLSFPLLVAVTGIFFVYPLENFSLWAISSESSRQSLYFKARIYQTLFLVVSAVYVNNIIFLLFAYVLSAFLLLSCFWNHLPSPSLNNSKKIFDLTYLSNQLVLSVIIFSQTLLLQLFLSDSLLKYGILGVQAGSVLYSLFQFEFLRFFESGNSLGQYRTFSLLVIALISALCFTIMSNVPFPSFFTTFSFTRSGICVFLLVLATSVLLAISTVYQKHLLNSDRILSRQPIYITFLSLSILAVIRYTSIDGINVSSTQLLSALLYSFYLFVLSQSIMNSRTVCGD